MILKLGSQGPLVSQLQRDLNSLAHLVPGPLAPMVVVDGDFGPKTEAAVKAAQKVLRCVPDGEVGPITQEAMDAFIGTVPPLVVVPATGTPWMDWMIARNGWTEFTHDKELSAYWKYSGLDYTTVIGASHAWCMLTVNAALHDTGYKGTGRADAKSGETLGQPCGWIYGAVIPIRHANGARHITFFDHWVEQKNMLVALRGGNQGNALCVATFNLSGNAHGKDECVSGPRWPNKA